jgi:trans-aconitate 2-methyltransferase
LEVDLMWDPAVYRRYGTERARPFFDLVSRIGAERPRAVVDLGCGPGDLTLTLAERWPDARLTGIDSSPEMVEKASGLGPAASFRLLDVRGWRPDNDIDVLVSNATLQWVPEHRDLLTRWARELPPGAWLAMQVPGNFDAPSHRAIRAVAARYDVGHLTREAPVDEPAGYASLMLAAGASVDAWETTYLHLLPDAGDEHPVLRWVEGTALRPVKAALDENAWREFRADLAREIAAAYPAAGGYVAFPFRRIFMVARTAAAEGTP